MSTTQTAGFERPFEGTSRTTMGTIRRALENPVENGLSYEGWEFFGRETYMIGKIWHIAGEIALGEQMKCAASVMMAPPNGRDSDPGYLFWTIPGPGFLAVRNSLT
jgi:hypothetical protein